MTCKAVEPMGDPSDFVAFYTRECVPATEALRSAARYQVHGDSAPEHAPGRL